MNDTREKVKLLTRLNIAIEDGELKQAIVSKHGEDIYALFEQSMMKHMESLFGQHAEEELLASRLEAAVQSATEALTALASGMNAIVRKQQPQQLPAQKRVHTQDDINSYNM